MAETAPLVAEDGGMFAVESPDPLIRWKSCDVLGLPRTTKPWATSSSFVNVAKLWHCEHFC